LRSGNAEDLGSAEGGEAVHQSEADLDFGSFAVWCSDTDAFSEGFETSQLRLKPASDMVSGKPNSLLVDDLELCPPFDPLPKPTASIGGGNHAL
jgi:hypothetical protein